MQQNAGAYCSCMTEKIGCTAGKHSCCSTSASAHQEHQYISSSISSGECGVTDQGLGWCTSAVPLSLQHILKHMASPPLLFYAVSTTFCTLVFDHTAMLWNWLRNHTLPAVLYISSCPTLLCETVVTLQNKVECNLTDRHCTCAQCTMHSVHISAMKRSICPWAVV